jgi:hypothetical protein
MPPPRDTFDMTVLSDAHRVPSTMLPPTITPLLISDIPAELPITVTLDVPVDATFVTLALLTVPTYVTADDTVPTSSPTDATHDRCPPAPPRTFPTMLLSDAQGVASSVPVPPSRPPGLYDAPPTPLPTIVTLVDPVLAAFVGTMLLSTGPSLLNTAESVAPVSLTVARTACPVLIIRSDFEAIALDDTHSDAPAAVSPRRIADDRVGSDVDPPTIVTDVAPLTTRFVDITLLPVPPYVKIVSRLPICSAALTTPT